MKAIAFLLALFTFCACSGQDSTKHATKIGDKKWTAPKTVGRLAVGVQKSAYVELGLARHSFLYNELGFASNAYYGAIEWTPIQNIFGLKGGYEINARIIALGLEAKYQTDLANSDVIITPKIGLGGMGIVNIFYGYNISLLNLPFSSVGRHQFSVVFNLNTLVFCKDCRR